MTESTLTGVLSTVIVLGLIVAGIGIFLAGVGSQYGSENVNDTFITAFKNESQRTTALLESARTDLETVEEDKGILDRLASFFRSGYDAAKGLLGALGSVTRLINVGISQVPFLGAYSSTLIGGLGILVLIVVIGIFMHFLIKSERV